MSGLARGPWGLSKVCTMCEAGGMCNRCHPCQVKCSMSRWPLCGCKKWVVAKMEDRWEVGSSCKRVRVTMPPRSDEGVCESKGGWGHGSICNQQTQCIVDMLEVTDAEWRELWWEFDRIKRVLEYMAEVSYHHFVLLSEVTSPEGEWVAEMPPVRKAWEPSEGPG